MYTLDDYLQAELKRREDIKQMILDVIMKDYEFGVGKTKRSLLHKLTYESFGGIGRCGNNWARFINSILVEKGCRMGSSHHQKLLYGIKKKPE